MLQEIQNMELIHMKLHSLPFLSINKSVSCAQQTLSLEKDNEQTVITLRLCIESLAFQLKTNLSFDKNS